MARPVQIDRRAGDSQPSSTLPRSIPIGGLKATSLPDVPIDSSDSPPSKSPLRRLFNRNILPSSPSSSSFFGLRSPSSPSKSTSLSHTVTFDIHLYDYGNHSEIRFEPNIHSPKHKQYEGFSNHPWTGYNVSCTNMTERQVISSRKADDGDLVARLRTSARGTEIGMIGKKDAGWIEEGDQSGMKRLHFEGAVYQWTEAIGLAYLVNLENRRKIAKLHFNVLAKDKLVIVEGGLDILPVIFLSAAKLWAEHNSGRDLRLK
ncbi:uncharacterized protein I303_100260 [Kwoniella dejecticola CBS 10117]|uniref:Uncharacterized protein n=1 Tax=Kwoniella dejecticola CBS 10117 TaxID=1296121 RepID=A0A1A6AEH3_9TREE|nr:uncharacterized protein I303_00261 [Kwoniella dejecticola CBS 10117]OBR88444.1 hypothetical protein I303_00261 [Kwoniella dejecticola CBS 10117]